MEASNNGKTKAETTKKMAAIDTEMDCDDAEEGFVSSDDEIDYSIKPEFYDPVLDDIDELWVQKQRRGQTSDVVLSCPACFTTLCLDCQRHEKYVTQYRAMFVFNCEIKSDRAIQQQRKSSRGFSEKNSISTAEVGAELVSRPVYCAVCSTEVGVYDADQVYHFFNVIPSNS